MYEVWWCIALRLKKHCAQTLNNVILSSIKLEQVEADYKKMIRRRYLFSTNFAIANADSEAAPYIALSELYDANIQLLDTINNSLTDKVKSSEYGKRLQKFVDDIKAKEEK